MSDRIRVSQAQPILASARRAVTRLSELGEPVAATTFPLPDVTRSSSRPPAELEAALDDVLAPHVLIELTAGPYGFERAEQVLQAATLLQGGWRSFLLKVRNPHGLQTAFETTTGGTVTAMPFARGMVTRPYLPDRVEFASTIRNEWWYELKLDGDARLSGLEIEYFVLSIYSRDAGPVSNRISFSLPQPRDDPFRRVASTTAYRRGDTWERIQQQRGWSTSFATAHLTFESAASGDVLFDIRDTDGRTCVAALTVRDDAGRVYPSRGLRLAPDMFFQDHVYRASGEPIRLPAGRYRVTATRGPEYLPTEVDAVVDGFDGLLPVRLTRWVDPASRGYYSGDPHIHGGGCAHYSMPTEGVSPETMIRHARGEGLWISSVLTWGPCYYYQKQFFTAETVSPASGLEHPEHQVAQGITWEPRTTDLDHESMLRYDLEVSGFPSSHSGHLILLGLTNQDYPGTSVLEDWPSWNLPIHQWAKNQGALTGFAHCGLGMATAALDLPNYEIPPFSSVGSNELLIDVPHEAADFLAGAELGAAAEMNIWYHLLNLGYRTLMMGETDYPCISDERPGIGRTYVKLPAEPRGSRAMESWISGLKTNPSYFGDGRSHIFDVTLDGDESREQTRESAGATVVRGTVAALLPEQRPAVTVEQFAYDLEPGPGEQEFEAWNLEWARLPGTRSVLVELVVNGESVASERVVADGLERKVEFEYELERSSWIALRILPSVHTQPVFVEIAGKPIRASRRSAQWLHDCVDQLWAVKHEFIRPSERPAARAAYDLAKELYAARRLECEVD